MLTLCCGYFGMIVVVFWYDGRMYVLRAKKCGPDIEVLFTLDKFVSFVNFL